MPQYFCFDVRLLETTQKKVIRKFAMSLDSNFRDLHHAIQDSFNLGYRQAHRFYDVGKKAICGGDNSSIAALGYSLPLSSYFKISGDCFYRYCVYVCQGQKQLEYKVRMKGLIFSQHAFIRRLIDGKNLMPFDENTNKTLDINELSKIFDCDMEFNLI